MAQAAPCDSSNVRMALPALAARRRPRPAFPPPKTCSAPRPPPASRRPPPAPCSLKRTVHARAYFDFLTPDDVLDFKSKFDGHVFVSTRGTQYRAAVEYAPFQRVPKPAAKKAPMEGTIEKGGGARQRAPPGAQAEHGALAG
jgi:hypothetical protein